MTICYGDGRTRAGFDGCPPDTQGDAVLYGTHKNPELDIGKLTHFAFGIFWKANSSEVAQNRRNRTLKAQRFARDVRRGVDVR